MSGIKINGRARRVGDHINTDYIIASARKRDTLDTAVLKAFLLEAVDPAFAASVRPGDVLVAGRNFGCGSAMEIAATVILAAGIRAVLASSFSRTFYRNAVNNGLLPVQCDTSGIREGDGLIIELDEGQARVTNQRTDAVLAGAAISGVMLDILTAGGLVPYVRQHGGFTIPA
jgi:3-isopropylmalate/(R)-2-methylmalate dehydratase small subunit